MGTSVRRSRRAPTLVGVRWRWSLVALLVVVAAVAVSAAAASSPNGARSQQHETAAGAELVGTSAAFQTEPGDGTVSTTVPPAFDDFQSMCPGLELDPELIPPYFERHFELIPDPDPFDVCLLLDPAAEAEREPGPSTP